MGTFYFAVSTPLKMTKTHKVEVTIVNNSDYELHFKEDKFEHGRLADGANWSKVISSRQTVTTLCYERDWALSGCSGWVTYTTADNQSPICFSFSNPAAGENGIDVGHDNGIWDTMTSHYITVTRTVHQTKESCYYVRMKSTSGDTNKAVFEIYPLVLNHVYSENQYLDDVVETFNSVSPANSRRTYFKCLKDPTDIPGLLKSHFKGISVYGGHDFNRKFIFSHTDVGEGAKNGSIIIAEDLGEELQTTENTLPTLHPGWRHPCSSQACGSYMALGIQEDVDSESSEIQILDIRPVAANLGPTIIGRIDRPTGGTNGVGMTRERGELGRYIVAAINGNKIDFYRSAYSVLPPFHPFGDFECLTPDHKLEFPVSGAGLGLVTQKDGQIFLIALDADDSTENNTAYLFSVKLLQQKNEKGQFVTLQKINQIALPVDTVSDSVKLFGANIALLTPVIGPILVALLYALYNKFGVKRLSNSFRYGKGLFVSDSKTIEFFATDRNVAVFPPLLGLEKNFSIMTWTGRAP
ncbi:dipeptidyl-peptidase 5 [Pseudozyma hubeiensis SY62]|uniref:Dipeptidyl-peptidase 5 n=1 Tax=Pseudozyma hubeiensis (strain SY62) TaxID=1305764 RepID=R9NY46_PSEHS|nr:dipeptidyl-peptidase 5 [Pseudozyma hubeiensis SY62]GAC93594.1 dipeptidyl-peptidase 5 [Pseudozyma hubeiensis SY62]